MTDVLYLAWRYLVYHRLKTVLLTTTVAVIVYLPAGLNLIASRSAAQLQARAAGTPLLVGAKGSPLELVLSSLYFSADVPPSLRYAQVARVNRTGLARGIPLNTRFRAGDWTIVGTSLEYFEFRQLSIDRGRQFGLLGECVIGADVAESRGADLGESLLSTPDRVFDIAGAYPLKMPVVGVLAPTGGPDDLAVFVDLRTTWVIEGLAHGHQDLTQPEAEAGILSTEDGKIIANASVVQYNEITPENVGTFHFHGDEAGFPMTGLIVVPADQKSSTLVEGRYLGDESVQMLRPSRVMAELLGTVLTIRRFLMFAVLLLGSATVATIVLVFALSLQLRRREMDTMIKIGGTRSRLVSLVAVEILGVLLAGVTVAGSLTLMTSWLASSATRWLVQTI